MSYIYDILLNFNINIYDFYEWNKNDTITHIKKIPIFKINRNKFIQIVSNNVSFDSKFLEKVLNKTEVYSKNHRTIKYSFLLTDGIDVIAIKVDDNIKFSKLLLDEELDILDIVDRLHNYDINFKILEKKENNYKTRYEIEKEVRIRNAIKNINNIDELKYLYYDCFNEKENNIYLIKNKLKENINNAEIANKINTFLNIKKFIY